MQYMMHILTRLSGSEIYLNKINKVFFILGLVLKLVFGILRLAFAPVKFILSIVFGIVAFGFFVAFGAIFVVPFLVLLGIWLFGLLCRVVV